MASTTPFATFYLDVTGSHAEEQIVHTLAQDGLVTFDTIQSTSELLQFCTRLPDGSICLRFRYDSLGYYTAPVCTVLPIFLNLLERHTISFTLQKQQGYILQNGRWLHGRTAFRGEREMYRVLVCTDPATPVGVHVHQGFHPDSVHITFGEPSPGE